MERLDPRLHAFRPDLADEKLRGRVDAARFVRATPAQVSVSLTPIHKSPKANAMQVSQALLGEVCGVFEIANGFAFVQMQRDGYVGYVAASALGPVTEKPSHRVCVPSSLLFPEANLKSIPAVPVFLNTEVSVLAQVGGYAQLAGGGYIFARHLQALDEPSAAFESVAERFLHTPYLWGGITVHGIDCSGLVQMALLAAGISSPRDSDMQEKALGVAVDDQAKLQRGDLVFWPGHVGLMQSATQILHANGHHLMVTSEPLQDVVARSDKAISSIKRLPAAPSSRSN